MGIGGRWIMIGQLTGEFVPFNPAQLFLKNVSMLSATSTTRKQLDDCLTLVARGVIKPIVSLALPLEQAARAHELVETGKSAGRIVLRPNG
jgi:D-arabinose 1-dehydrogenase-like Zn-dependent alcohol dehydrogenase